MLAAVRLFCCAHFGLEKKVFVYYEHVVPLHILQVKSGNPSPPISLRELNCEQIFFASASFLRRSLDQAQKLRLKSRPSSSQTRSSSGKSGSKSNVCPVVRGFVYYIHLIRWIVNSIPHTCGFFSHKIPGKMLLRGKKDMLAKARI